MIKAKTAVVLGASGEIGQAICKKLAQTGWSVYIHFNKNETQAKLLQAELTTAYPQLIFHIIHADFTEVDGAINLAKQVQNVQAVVIANGQSMYKLLSETTSEDMDALWKVHMQNPAKFIGLVSPQLRSHRISYVVFIGSIWGSAGAAGEVMYSAVKGAQHAFVKAYAKEAAYAGIRVNGVAPGWIETSMNNSISTYDREFVLGEIPLQTIGSPQDVSEAVHFLVSGNADYMTGEIMKVNGGWHM